MEITDNIFDIHVFVCTNNREDKVNCADSGGVELLAALRAELLPLRPKLRVNKAGCLGRCAEGAVAVIYPEGKWFSKLDQEGVGVMARYISEKYKQL